MDYRKCAQEIYDLVGKRENLVSAAHCATRLRLVTADNSKVDIKKLEDVDGVKGVFSSNGQLQIILGTGTVNKVYDEFLSISGMTAATKADVKAAAAAKQPLPFRMIRPARYRRGRSDHGSARGHDQNLARYGNLGYLSDLPPFQ